MVPFVRLVQSRMHGLKKRNKSVMIEPDVKTSGFFTSRDVKEHSAMMRTCAKRNYVGTSALDAGILQEEQYYFR